ncbi:MAG: DUF4105 domain-containing protein [Phycisphaeraceae bacterium]
MAIALRDKLVIVLLWMVWAGSSTAALAQPAEATRGLSDEAEVSILTMYPGSAIHARFGHTAIRVHDPLGDIDAVYNYGTFNFDSPMFVVTFIRGQLDYHLSEQQMANVLYQYQHIEQRAVVEQVLDLTAAEREAVFAYLRVNAQPANATYRYRFLDDNCSTRVRDVFEDVLGERLRFEEAPEPATTYRAMLAPYMANARLLWLGVTLVMGQPGDEAVGRRERMFLPVPLMEAFDAATVAREGEARPLVREKQALYWYEGADTIEPTVRWPALAAWGLLVVGAVVTWREVRGRGRMGSRRRRGVSVADALLLGVTGLAGVVVAGMWLGTEHDVTGPNWNLLWAWPTHLLAAVALWRWPGARWLRVYLLAAAGVTLLAALTWPAWPQTLPLALWPVLLLIALRAGALGVRAAPRPRVDERAGAG